MVSLDDAPSVTQDCFAVDTRTDPSASSAGRKERTGQRDRLKYASWLRRSLRTTISAFPSSELHHKRDADPGLRQAACRTLYLN